MATFNEFVRQATPVKPLLPLLHTCDGFGFRSIIARKTLDVAPSNDFGGEPLLFFFYGRPSYRTSGNNPPTSVPAFFPVAFAVDSSAMRDLRRIAPFDTGAFLRALFSEYAHPNMKCDDFLVEPELEMAARIVSRFYGSNENYYRQCPLQVLIPPLEFEAFTYYQLIQAKGTTSYDDRCASVELQSGSAVHLSNNNVKFVVLPGVFLDDAAVRNVIINQWKARVATYRIHHGSPREYLSKVYEEVETFLRNDGYFS